jgi:hypothetical protein
MLNPIQIPSSVTETMAWAFLRKTPAAIALAALIIVGFVASIFAPLIREQDTLAQAKALSTKLSNNPSQNKDT